MKKKFLILGIVFISLLILSFFKNQLIKSAVVIGTSRVVGAPVSIDSFSLGIFNHSIKIKGFKLYNPKGYPEGVLLDIPKIMVSYDLPVLLKRGLHLFHLTVDLKEIDVVKNKGGELNVDSLEVAQAKQKPSKSMPMRIDLLTLSIGDVVYKDYSGDKPSIEVYNVGIKDKHYGNITSAQQLAVLILTEPMKKTAIKGAQIYGIAALTGVGLLPVGAASILFGKDSQSADFNADFDRAYNISLNTVKQMGEVIKEEKNNGTINGRVKGNAIVIKIVKKTRQTVQIIVSARKLLLPRPRVAGGVLHEISEKLK